MKSSSVLNEISHDSWWSRIEAHERPAVGWASAWFFFILLSYLIVRPVRETMASIGGMAVLQGLMLATFLAMLVSVPIYSILVARLPRRWLVRVVYHFFAGSLFVFFLLMQIQVEVVQVWTARTFFVWVNVFALFATSVFWSVLADLYTSSQGKRLFGLIAAGGTAGAIAGSLITSQLATRLSTGTLLLLPIAVIEMGLWCAWRLEKQTVLLRGAEPASDAGRENGKDTPTGGGLFSGITHVMGSSYLALICLFLLFVQACGTQLYFEQNEIVAATIETKGERTRLFAYLDLGTQVLTLLIQALCSSVILRRFGISVSLAILPMVYMLGFASLAANQSLVVLVVTMIATRASAYGLTVPAKEVLFTVVSREDKYKSKSFIDTVVLRGGDAASAQVFGVLRWLELSLTAMNMLVIPVTIIWAVVGWKLGRRQAQMSQSIAVKTKPE